MIKYKDMTKEQKKRLVVFSVITLSVLAIVIGTTYAFFAGNFGQTQNEVITVKSGSMVLTFTDNSDGIEKNDLKFGDTVEKELKIENAGTLDAYAKISWDNLKNTFLDGSLTYILEYKTSETGNWQNIKIKYNNVPTSSSPNKYEIVDGLLIPIGATYTYKITIKYNDLDVDQTQDLNANFRTKFILEEASAPLSVMMARASDHSIEKIWGHSADVKKIVFENELEPKENATYTYDISAEQNKSVMSYLVPDSQDNTKFVLYIQGDEEIIANENCSWFFNNFVNLESIENLEYLDTSNVTSMMGMFVSCSSLSTLDLKSFDTSNVTNMEGMFFCCRNLSTLDLGSFNTSNVTNMSQMFVACDNLTTLNLSNFDVSSVINKASIFQGISSTIKITVSNETMKTWVINASDNPKLNTSNVIVG